MSYDQNILNTLKLLSHDDKIDYLRKKFKVNAYVKNALDINEQKLITLPLYDIENAALFKLIEYIIEMFIHTQEEDVYRILDDYVYYTFLESCNIEYLSKSKYIIWLSKTYEHIIYDYKIEENREIPVNYYKNRSLRWLCERYFILKNIDRKEISCNNVISKDINELFEYNEVLKFAYDINPIVTLKHIFICDFHSESVKEIIYNNHSIR